MTPRPQNRPRKTGKLTPWKNSGTTGSAGRSDPARDACGRPRAFHLLFFHTSLHCWFLRKPCARWEVKSLRIRRLRWRLLSGLRCFLSFLPNSPLWGPNRPLTVRRRVVPPPGVETATRGLLGATRGLVGFVGRLNVGGFPKCRKERKGRRIPLEGRGRDLRHLPGLFQGCKEAMRASVLFSLHTICRLFYCPKHKMSMCTPAQFAPLHPSFFSQPIPLVGQADGLHIAS